MSNRSRINFSALMKKIGNIVIERNFNMTREFWRKYVTSDPTSLEEKLVTCSAHVFFC